MNFIPSVLSVKATASLDKEIQKELETDTPTAEVARAMLEDEDENSDQNKQSAEGGSVES